MKFKNQYLIGIAIGAIVLFIDVAVFMDTQWFIPLIVVAVTIGWMQIWIDFFIQNQKQKEIETRFLDFVRNLTGAIKSGMPVSRSIIHISRIDYGALTPFIRKLGHQVEWAIPVHKALLFFSNSTKNDVIKRSISTVIEAEQSGGNMEDVLESITASLIEIKKIKEERRARIHAQVLQSYIIFFIFIGVMIVIQNMLVPYLIGSGEEGSLFSGLNTGALTGSTTSRAPSIVMTAEIKYNSLSSFVLSLTKWFSSLTGVFMMLTLIQGFFAGVIVGKLSEGDIIAGLKHSMILMTISFFIMTLFAVG
ncbi:type II secretion system F family protein [Candidatus Woesearchaeota archaeon]|nr:type II secretion system F family protein [Candidatus Woesearchaeota archaeon]